MHDGIDVIGGGIVARAVVDVLVEPLPVAGRDGGPDGGPDDGDVVVAVGALMLVQEALRVC
jgi:hypothetical protein